jgi:hypothetical protein
MDQEKVEGKELDRTENNVWDEGPIHFEQVREIRRLKWANVGEEVSEALNINKGLVYTVVGLTVRPADTIREYLQEGRYRVLNPAKYFVLVVGIILFVATRQGYFDDMSNIINVQVNGDETEEEQVRKVEQQMGIAFQEYFVKYQNFWSIGTIALTAIFTWLFFIKGGYNYLEHVVINTYVFLHSYWIFLIALLLNKPWMDYIMPVYFLYYFILLIVVLKQLSGKGWFSAILRSVAAMTVAILLFSVVVAGLTIWYLRTQIDISEV